MFIAESTYGENLTFTAFSTAEEAVAHLLDLIGPDYADKFWASPDGKSIITATYSTPDFSLRVHPSIRVAVESQLDLDPEAIPDCLRALADGIEAGVDAEIE